MSILPGKFVGLKQAVKRLYWRLKFYVAPEPLPKNPDGKVYLNLGCGSSTSSEFINIDAVPLGKTHYLSDVRDLSRFPDNSVDLIYASHVIEHLPRTDLPAAFAEWYRALKPGGILRFGVPDFDALIRMYERSGRSVDAIVNQLMGQEAPYDDHHSIWNTEYATRLLTATGFVKVRAWDPETVDHHAFTDKTNRAYRIGGEQIPFSLNLEAEKP